MKGAQSHEQGNIMLSTVIVLLALTLVIAACMNIASKQVQLATLSKNTSTTYLAAQSAAEKQVDTINKAVESQLSYIVETISEHYVGEMVTTSEAVAKSGSDSGCADITYNGSQLQVKQEVLQLRLYQAIYDYIKKNYVTNLPDGIQYNIKGDRVAAGYTTEVVVKVSVLNPEPTTYDRFNLEVIAKTTNGTDVYDEQKIKAEMKISLPTTVENEFKEKYDWVYHSTELLSNPLVSFSDVVIDKGSLTVEGDMLVKGYYKNSFSDPDEAGGVIAINGGQIYVKGDLCCMSNIMVSNGWNSSSRDSTTNITVEGNAIANTIGIVDDFYEGGENQEPYSGNGQVKGASINIHKDAMVENDVMIDRWVNGCKLTVDGVIFGVGKGTDSIMPSGGGAIVTVDPNTSSGIFSKGEDSKIVALGGIYVLGQAFVTLGEGRKPQKLWESVGEPFDDVSSLASYKDINNVVGEDSYLLSTSPLNTSVKKNKVILGQSNHTYAPGRLSVATSETDVGRTILSNGPLGNAGIAEGYLIGGTYYVPISNLGGLSNLEVDQIILAINGGNYYSGGSGLLTKDWCYGKIFSEFGNNNFGLKGYMIAKRSVFYDSQDVGNKNGLRFSQVVGKLPHTANSWSYEEPILIQKGGLVELEKFYIDDGTGFKAHNSIIVNPSNEQLILKGGSGIEFNGVIISAGPVKIDGDLTINGSLIIGDNLEMPSRRSVMTGTTSGLSINGNVTLKPSKDIIFKIDTQQYENYRQILDALKITQYSQFNDEGKFANIFKPITIDKTTYSVGKSKISSDTYLTVNTDNIVVGLTKVKSE